MAEEQDHLLALSIAKLLGVELDPWQERLLTMMLAAHRDEDVKPRVSVGAGTCGARKPLTFHDEPRMVCARSAGHGGAHQAPSGIRWSFEPVVERRSSTL